ncbi:SCO0930 family lipoprotein [Amycolatopsis sp. NPDC057786]|uniref:SCO0930 family lipoprotein n=1 Tax=Amycolatopsis sp. NPDC057786 TaxID=3346250 RepID=UPI003670A3A2
MLRKRFVVAAASAAVGLVALSACSGGTETAAPAVAPAAAVAGAGGNAPAAKGETKLAVAEAGDLGQVLVDKDGFTLYRFDKDSAKPPKSNCDGDCAKTWPPVLAEGEVQIEGVDQALVSEVTRTDGRKQVTVDGWALYRYAKDAKAGEAKGQGVGGTWYAANAKGGKAGQAAKEAKEAPAEQKEGDTKLVASNVDGIGPAIVDKEGFTLYMFTKDKKNKQPTCNGDCAKTWPPVLAEGEVQLEGIDQKLLGTVKRADGTTQVTVGGWAVYRYAKDANAGEANGHGVGGTWFVIEPAGCKSTAPVKNKAAQSGNATSKKEADAPAQEYGY